MKLIKYSTAATLLAMSMACANVYAADEIDVTGKTALATMDATATITFASPTIVSHTLASTNAYATAAKMVVIAQGEVSLNEKGAGIVQLAPKGTAANDGVTVTPKQGTGGELKYWLETADVKAGSQQGMRDATNPAAVDIYPDDSPNVEYKVYGQPVNEELTGDYDITVTATLYL